MRRVQHPEPFDDVRRIAVLRGGGLGDLMFAEPALRALAHAYPAAQITLMCFPAQAALLAGRPSPVHHIEVLPVVPGIRPGVEDPPAAEAWLQRMRDEHFDLAVQVHGGGRYSNPFLLQLGARHTVGLATAEAAPLERTMPYVYYQHEVLRALEVVALAGAQPVALEAELEVTDDDRRRAAPLLPAGDGPLLVIHPGATDPRRRWPADRFAEVAAQAVASGMRVAAVADASEAEIADAIVDRARDSTRPVDAGRLVSLAGRADLGQLMGIFAHAAVVLGNDSGPRHLAQAAGAPTVGIYWVGNLINAGPLTRAHQRALVSWTNRCPECDIDVTQSGAERCEHDVSFVTDVSVRDALEAILAVTRVTARSHPLPV
ncbi:glycosyltransferase family 9 protein [Cryobacterium tepidiphilum]|uniref:Glycosyltransferase family 9 protein n=1 Tax=Cryobacterium tepidiphilum TaxID=2486026 RepID=A0A3M8LA75_9MICO|nr:glycosyltransferase family 9 protein [Cryobacterium tepidiphilum]RNE62403.1 glycosyltransferase family 9 protein [Cryobacterium tepidiphilum]